MPELFLQSIIMHDSPVSQKCHFTMSMCVHVCIHTVHISIKSEFQNQYGPLITGRDLFSGCTICGSFS